MIVKVGKRLIALVFLYGTNPTAVLLEDCTPENFNDLEGLVCDWEHRKETDIIKYISKLCEDDE